MNNDHNVHFHFHLSPELATLGGNIVSLLRGMSKAQEQILMNLSDLQAKADATLQQVQSDTSVVNSVKTLVDSQNATLTALKQQIADLQSQNDPNALQKLSDTIDAILSTDTSNSQIVAGAVTSSTPSADPTQPAA